MRVERSAQNQVSTQVAQGPRASVPESSLGQVAQLASQGLQGMQQQQLQQQRLQRQQQQEAAQASAESALLQFQQQRDEFLMTPGEGYFSLQGRDAYEQSSAALERLQQLREEAAASLEDDEARKMFDRAANAHLLRSTSDIRTFAERGLKTWQAANALAVEDQAIRSASMYWNQQDMPSVSDPTQRVNRLEVSRIEGEQALLDRLERTGISDPDVVRNEMAQFNSSFYSAAIRGALTEGSAPAKELLEKYGNRVWGADYTALTSAIAQTEQREAVALQEQDASRWAANIFERATGASEANRIIREEIDDPEVAASVRARVQRQFSERKWASEYDAAESYLQAEQALLAGGSAEQFIAQFPEKWDAMTSSQQQAIRHQEFVSTDWVRYQDILALSTEELAELNIAEESQYLAPSQRLTVLNMARQARETLQKPASERDPDVAAAQVGQTLASQTQAAVYTMYGTPDKWNDERRRQAAQFYRDVQRSAEIARVNLGVETLTPDQFAKVLDEQTAVHLEDRRFWFGQRERDVSDVPAIEQQIASDFLVGAGMRPTAENLIRVSRGDLQDIPEDDFRQVALYIRQAFGREPTIDQVIRAYQAAQEQ